MNRRQSLSLLASGFLGLHGTDLTNRKEILATKANTMKNINISTPTMKTIGIIGGMGPQATTDLEMRIHKVAQQMLTPNQNGSYPPMIVEYYRHPPMLLKEDNYPVFPIQADPRLLDVAKNLGTRADFLILPTNGVHRFKDEIEKASGRTLLSMIDATLEEVEKRKWQKVGVLGLMTIEIYTSRLKEMGISFETINGELQKKIDQTIFKVMEGRDDETDVAVVFEAINELRNKKVNGIIPGCTEIPLLLGKNIEAADLVNPVQLLAEAAMKFALHS